jgi:hypothetical protein
MKKNESTPEGPKTDPALAARFPGLRPLCDGRNCAGLLGCSAGYLSAVKKAMGVHAKWLDPQVIRDWIVAHPEFRSSDVYPIRKGGRDGQ